MSAMGMLLLLQRWLLGQGQDEGRGTLDTVELLDQPFQLKGQFPMDLTRTVPR